MPQRRCLGIGFALVLADIGLVQNVHAFGVSSHHAVFNAVMYHFHKVPRSMRAAMQIATIGATWCGPAFGGRSEEHTSELQSLMRISYAVFCLKKKTLKNNTIRNNTEILKHTINKSQSKNYIKTT